MIAIRRNKNSRNGTAAVEASLMMPILLFIFLGAIDVAQYINVSQVVTNASREGAMVAIKNTTTNEQDVIAAVQNYLIEHYPSLESNSGTLNVTVAGASGEKFGSAESGDAISVTVTFEFADVRWIPGPEYWSGLMRSQTISRKQ